MKNQKSVQLFEASEIQSRIVAVRNVQVMLDRDLAVLYGVQTKVLNQAVKRNIERFPDRFMFRLVESEMRELVTNCDRFETLKHSGVPMYAFTEQGVAMLSAVLRSKIAIDVSIRIMDAFVAMRRFAYDHAGLVQRVGAIELKQLETDKRIDTVFDALDRGKPTQTEIAKFNRQYKGLAVTYSDDFHDRFLIIDNIELHGLGSSINCLGRRVTSYTTRDAKEIAKLLAMVQ